MIMMVRKLYKAPLMSLTLLMKCFPTIKDNTVLLARHNRLTQELIILSDSTNETEELGQLIGHQCNSSTYI